MSLFFGDNGLEDLKSRIDIEDVVSRLGIETRRSGSTTQLICPNPLHDDRHFGSCYINKRIDKVVCMACGARYDCIDLIRVQYGCNTYEAACTLAEMFGLTSLYEDNPHERKRHKMALWISQSEKELIGIHTERNPNKCYLPVEQIPVKGGEKHVIADRDGDGYIKCREFPNPNILLKENEEVFRFVIVGKCNEKLTYYKEMILDAESYISSVAAQGYKATPIQLKKCLYLDTMAKEAREKIEEIEKLKERFLDENTESRIVA